MKLKITKFFPFDFKTLILFAFIINALVSCQSQRLPFIPTANSRELKEVRLGQSNYYLLLPDNFELLKSRGKEGQLGYDIIPKDISSTMSGFIEIRHGHPIGNDFSYGGRLEGITESFLAGKKVRWEIHRTETGYYEAFTSEGSDLNANVSSKVGMEIRRLISIIATLKIK